MTDDIYSQMVASGRITSWLAEQRKLRESGAYTPDQRIGASRGYLAGRLSNYVGVIHGTLRLSGLLARGRSNARTVEIRQNQIKLPTLSSVFDGFTILHLSDLHLDLSEDMGPVIAAAIDGLNYDICVITGDFRANTSGPWQPCLEAFKIVRNRITQPIYAVLGNHDSLEIAYQLENNDVTVLLNEHRNITKDEHTFALVGIDDSHYFETDDLAAAIKGVSEQSTKILLSHTPESYLEAAKFNIDCLFAGHTHGGQICLPGGIPVIVNADCPRKYCRGAWQYQNVIGYTSSGTGSSVIDVRFNCPPEAVLHRLSCS